MIAISKLFELRVFSKKETDANRESDSHAVENMDQKSKAIDNMTLRNSPLDKKGISLLRKSIGLKHGSIKLIKRMGDLAPSSFQKKTKITKAKLRIAA